MLNILGIATQEYILRLNVNFFVGHAGQKIALQGPSFLDTVSRLSSDILVLLEHLASACSFISSSRKGGPSISTSTSDSGGLDP